MLTIALTDGIGGWRIDCAWRDIGDLSRLLSPDEHARCDGVRLPHAANARRAAHGLKHEMRRRRPDLPQVSLSHTNGAAAVAASRNPVGVDVEAVDGDDDVARLATRYFSAETARVVLSAADPRRVFAVHWTAREALLKTSGLTFTQAMATTLPFDAPALPLACATPEADFTVFVPSPGYVCAVVRRRGPSPRTTRTSH